MELVKRALVKVDNSKGLNGIAFHILPLIVFAIFLQFRIPSSISKFFSHYSIWLLIVLVALFYFSISLPTKWRWPVVYSLVMLLFALPLMYRWASGHSDAAMIGGLLPYKDGFNYFNSARVLLSGQDIPSFSMSAAWRPLFTGFLASLLYLVNGNLQLALAILIGLTGFCVAISVKTVYDAIGKWSSIIYIVLIFLYIQSMIGYPRTEVLGLALGCLGFVILYEGSQSKHYPSLVFGLVVMVAAVSIRAGAFFIFPFLIIWIGFHFNEKERFSWQKVVFCALILMAVFLFLNWFFPSVIVEPSSQANGNFAFTLYGQVLGGASWTQAIVDLETTDTRIIYRAALSEFVRHPHSLLIAAAKSFRDFFLPSRRGIFSFVSTPGLTRMDILLWTLALLSFLAGLFRVIKNKSFPLPSLLLAIWLGTFFSIPFLPPIDGGKRFHASTVLFFFMVVAFSLANLDRKPSRDVAMKNRKYSMPIFLSSFILFLTCLSPLVLMKISEPAIVKIPECPVDQVKFAVMINPGAYIDIIPPNKGFCGYAPDICFDDFFQNGTEKNIDDFFQQLLTITKNAKEEVRIVPGNEIIQGRFGYFVGSTKNFGDSNLPFLAVGCASEIKTKHQQIYIVENTNH